MSNLLSTKFLAPYYAKGDVFPNLLARATYLSKYSRDGEVWTDTIRRVVEGNCALDPKVKKKEAEELFDAFWTMQALPPGRGLWVGGVPGIPPEARFNCWYVSLRSPKDWAWVADQLMLGGGVGVGLQDIHKLPRVVQSESYLAIVCNATHPDVAEYEYDNYRHSATTYRVADTRKGWVKALHMCIQNAFKGVTCGFDVSNVRARGTKIKTFGGVACGPAPLARMLRSVWDIIRGAAGRRLTSVECLDITNHIGLCIKSGNVRRSALIVLGGAEDVAFRESKKDFEAVKSHRHTSNNTVVLRTSFDVHSFDWASLVEDMSVYGEPGILNLHLIRKTDPKAEGVNPCGEQALENKEACNLAEVFPSRIPGGPLEQIARGHILRLVTRYCIRQRLTPLSHPTSRRAAEKNMRIGVGLGGLCDFKWSKEDLAYMYKVCRTQADGYAKTLGVNAPITVTTVKPSGTISLLNGSSPGIHAPFAEYYIRRVRMATNDPFVAAFKEAGLTYEPCVYDATGNTLVFNFPMHAPNAVTTVQNQTLREQFERQLQVQENWADNAVSSTITFGEDEKDLLALLLEEYVPRLKSVSCLPKAHGYAQAPYEAIDKETYERLSKGVNNAHPLTLGGSVTLDECEGGVCPVQ